MQIALWPYPMLQTNLCLPSILCQAQKHQGIQALNIPQLIKSSNHHLTSPPHKTNTACKPMPTLYSNLQHWHNNSKKYKHLLFLNSPRLLSIALTLSTHNKTQLQLWLLPPLISISIVSCPWTLFPILLPCTHLQFLLWNSLWIL